MIMITTLIVFFGVILGFILNSIDEHLVELIEILKEKENGDKPVTSIIKDDRFEDDGK